MPRTGFSVLIFVCQAECDELAQRAEALKEENASLRSEVNRIKSEYEQLRSENASLKVMFKSWYGQALVFILIFFPRMECYHSEHEDYVHIHGHSQLIIS